MELPEGTRVLVIEDNESNRRLARAMLGQLGCEILEAADAEAGLALARTARPAVILLDLHLPGMDGHVSKPVRYQELFVELQRLIHTAVPA